MAGAPHRIRRQRWAIRTRSAGDAFALRGQLRAAMDGVLIPALEAAFDEMAVGERVVRIPRLEIHLRADSAEELLTTLPRLLGEALSEQLRPFCAAAATEEAEPSVPRATAADPAAMLLHYLRIGSLPWTATGRPPDLVMDELRAAASAGWAWLFDAARAAPRPEAFCFRLLHLLDERAAPGWIEALPPSVPPLWKQVIARLLAPAADTSHGAEARYARLNLAAALVSAALTAAPAPGPAALLAAAMAGADAETRASRGRMLRRLSGIPEMPDALDGAGVRGGERSDEGGEGTPATDPGLAHDAGGSARGARGGDRAATMFPMPSPAEDDFGISIANAGLVLLHPFIGPILERTGLSAGERLRARSLPRAAALLHYLVTGRTELAEFELELVKLLLGLSPDAPLPVAGGLLLPADTDEAEALLRFAIEHWSVLRDTSPAAFRASFLQRHGLLYRSGAAWTLRVQPAPFDVLLSHLPWGFQIVRLPWMNEPIYTEWPTP